MIPIFIKSKSFGLVGSDKFARILSFKNHFLPYGALQGQVRKNFEAKGLLTLEKRMGYTQTKKGAQSPFINRFLRNLLERSRLNSPGFCHCFSDCYSHKAKE
jgi:hypothetical protein